MRTPTPTLIGQRVRDARERQRMSRGTLAAKAGVSYAFVAQLENGARTKQGADFMQRIADALDVPLPYLLTGSIDRGVAVRLSPASVSAARKIDQLPSGVRDAVWDVALKAADAFIRFQQEAHEQADAALTTESGTPRTAGSRPHTG